MFKGLSNLANLGSMLKQAQQMGSRLQTLNEDLKAQRATGTAGGGMVSVEVNGLGDVLRCRIEPAAFASGDREMLEDLLTAAINQAQAKSKQMHAEAVRTMTQGLDVPGLSEMLAHTEGSDP